MIEDHYTAVKDMIRPGLTVYLWEVENVPDYPYVLFWGSLGNESTPTLTGPPRDFDLPIRATYVGFNPLSVIGLAMDVRQDLQGRRPEVAGWSVEKLEVAALTAISPDETVTVPNFGHPVRAVDEITVRSTRIV